MKRLLMLLVLAAVACGGADDSATSLPNAAPEVDAEVQAIADAIVAAHGEDGGFDAVVWAFERGYSGDQLFAGALDGRLRSDGVITTPAGRIEPPDSPALGLIVLPDQPPQGLALAAVLAVYRTHSPTVRAFQPITVEEYEEILGDAAIKAFLTRILGAAEAGYSGQQIIEFVIEGGSFDELVSENNSIDAPSATCVFIRDLTGQVVVPAFDAPLVEENVFFCTEIINDRALYEESLRDEEETPDSSAVAGDAAPGSDNFRARGPMPSDNPDVTLTFSDLVVDFCADGQVFASFEVEGLTEDDGGFTTSGSGDGHWDTTSSTFTVTGSWSQEGFLNGEPTAFSGEWNVTGMMAIADSTVTATDSFDQTVVLPITDGAPEGCG